MNQAGRLPTYFLLTFALSWSLWLAASTLPAGAARGLVILVGVFAPGIVALTMTGRSSGTAGVVALGRRLVDWQVPARWYLFAISFMAAVKLAVAAAHRVATGSWPPMDTASLPLMLAATIFSTMTGGQAGEEIGWRGYALPRLAQRFGLGRASLLLGVVWAAWHLPLFLMLDADTFGQSFPLYLLQVTALSVVLAWVWGHTRGSLLPVMLLHAAVNNTKDIVPSAEPGATNPWALSHSLVGWRTAAALWLVASYCLVRMGKLAIPGDGPAVGPPHAASEGGEER